MTDPPLAMAARQCGVTELRSGDQVVWVAESTTEKRKRFHDAVALADATRANVQAICACGAGTRSIVAADGIECRVGGAARVATAFAMIGDSITKSANFIEPLAKAATVDEDYVDALAIIATKKESVLERFKGSFSASAKVADVNMHADYPFGAGARTYTAMHASLRPAYALVRYGTNDATAYDDASFHKKLKKLVEDLEAHGTIPILSTIPKHGRGGRTPCGKHGDVDQQLQTNKMSRTIAQLALEKHLPLIDLRYALERLLNAGITHVGIHLPT